MIIINDIKRNYKEYSMRALEAAICITVSAFLATGLVLAVQAAAACN